MWQWALGLGLGCKYGIVSVLAGLGDWAEGTRNMRTPPTLRQALRPSTLLGFGLCYTRETAPHINSFRLRPLPMYTQPLSPKRDTLLSPPPFPPSLISSPIGKWQLRPEDTLQSQVKWSRPRRCIGSPKNGKPWVQQGMAWHLGVWVGLDSFTYTVQ